MRKSKSWFNASSGSHRSGHSISIDGTPQTIPPHAAKENSGTEELRTPKLRVSQSMGLLPKNGNQTAFCGSRTGNDFAAKTARELANQGSEGIYIYKVKDIWPSCKETVKATPHEVKTFCSQNSTSFERGRCMGKESRGFDFGSTGDQETVYDEEKSRVTSWADSVTSPAVSQMAIDWEDEKLPVIGENAAQACNIESSGSTTFKIDSQRVYSALMKRVKENERRTVSGRRATTGAPSYDYNPTHQIVNCPNDHKDPQQYTIRHVRSDYNMFDDNWDGATSLNSKTPKISMRSNLDMPYSLTSRRSSPNPWTEDVNVLSQSCSFSSPQASENDRRLVSERSSAFFASPTSHLFRTASPYRRALRESMKEAETAARTREAQGLGAGYLESLSAISLPTRRASTGFSERPVNMNYAESVYSDTYDSEANDSTSVVQKTPHLYENEESFTEQSYPCYVNSHQCGSVSPLSFVEWKKTASLHAMGLEEVQVQGGEVPTPNLPRTFPIFSHVREHAEIDSTTELMTSSMTSKLVVESTNIPISKITAFKQDFELKPDFQMGNFAGGKKQFPSNRKLDISGDI
ncbi:hypothetical protein GMORB2_7224 [Geosmithia morbida]|uniref:Uncharacterized protein n=1 Tax=Geosmithia morbida TaxID=1094350 RepID=A0A9P4YW63_9HYPO|nr:uncharacterized protein GMORB2_7224 [Geosmithia morbida]KAF4122917.1 hypothetical protein GMORB2_7224 [Geosmithia morbida]